MLDITILPDIRRIAACSKSVIRKVCAQPKQSLYLAAARQRRGETIESLAIQLCISEEYLLLIEEEDYDKIPLEPVYIRLFICQYAKALGVSATEACVPFDRWAVCQKGGHFLAVSYFSSLSELYPNSGCLLASVVCTICFIACFGNSYLLGLL
jgi:hypothetical protein